MSDEQGIPEPACTTCHRVHGVDGWNPRHVPTYADGNHNAIPPRRRVNPDPRRDAERHLSQQLAGSRDSGLRLALILAGVITREQVDAGDAMLATATGKILAEQHTHYGPTYRGGGDGQ